MRSRIASSRRGSADIDMDIDMAIVMHVKVAAGVPVITGGRCLYLRRRFRRLPRFRLDNDPEVPANVSVQRGKKSLGGIDVGRNPICVLVLVWLFVL